MACCFSDNRFREPGEFASTVFLIQLDLVMNNILKIEITNTICYKNHCLFIIDLLPIL